jgi:signal transduction histidine kinase/CHASE3 domain sensor protein/CheY-like chemotaxis protein
MNQNTEPITASSPRSRAGIGPELRPTALERKIQAGFGLALAILAIVGLLSYLIVKKFREDAALTAHTQAVIGGLEALFATTVDAESAQRGFLITGEESYLRQFAQYRSNVEAELHHLRGLTADNPLQHGRIAALEPLIEKRLATAADVIATREREGFEAAQRRIVEGRGKTLQDEIRAAVDQLHDEEERLLRQRMQETGRTAQLTLALIITGGVLAVIVVGLALYVLRRDMARRVRAEAELTESKTLLEQRVRERTAELERSNEKLQDSERLLEETSEIAKLGGWDFDPVTGEGNWTAEVARIHEMDPGMPISKQRGLDFYPGESRHRIEAAVKAAIEHGSPYDLELELVSAKGTHKWIRTIGRPIVQNGRTVKVRGAFQDITDRKVVERRLQSQMQRLTLLQQITRAIGERHDVASIMQVTISTVEAELPLDFGCILRFEHGSTNLEVACIGSASRAVAVQLGIAEEQPLKIDNNGLSRCVAGQLVYEPDVRDVAFPFPQRLAGAGLCSLVAAPLLVESKVFGVVVCARREAQAFNSGECEFIRQVSEHLALASHQAQLYEALLQSYEDLRQTQQAVMQQERLRALGQMASGIAHDINNAISPVALYTETLLEKEEQLSQRARDYLETIQRAVGDVAQTVTRMGEFYRRREPNSPQRAVNLNALVQQTFDLTRARWSDMAQERGVDIEVRKDLAPDLPPVMATESEIREALTNLVFNAVDAMPLGGTIMVRTGVSGGAGRKVVRLEVTDTGVGMDEETRRRCLEPFFTTKGERGTGLGLAMVYGTMQRHGADIEIDSAPGKGTTVRLQFAASSGESQAAVEQAARVPRGLRILLVDDDPLLLKSLRDALEGDDHVVTVANGGQAGIDTFREVKQRGEPFNVVITDLGMPYVDGRKVATAVKAEAASVAVLLLTGWGQRMVSEGDVPPGVDRVLSKPPRLRELREALLDTVKTDA